MLNPFRIWLMVVLIVGISLGSYVLYRLVSGRAGTLLGGVLGGLISSTATTVSHARSARGRRERARSAAAVVMLASTTIFARIFLEVAVVAPDLLAELAAPLGTMAAMNVGLCGLALARIHGDEPVSGPSDPAELEPALVFGALYGAILLAVAAAKEHFGDVGLYAVAALSGLTDVDAITLSVANLSEAGRLGAGTSWRAILLAVLANLVFKGAVCFVLGGAALLRPVALLFVPSLLGGAGILALWP